VLDELCELEELLDELDELLNELLDDELDELLDELDGDAIINAPILFILLSSLVVIRTSYVPAVRAITKDPIAPRLPHKSTESTEDHDPAPVRDTSISATGACSSPKFVPVQVIILLVASIVALSSVAPAKGIVNPLIVISTGNARISIIALQCVLHKYLALKIRPGRIAFNHCIRDIYRIPMSHAVSQIMLAAVRGVS